MTEFEDAGQVIQLWGDRTHIWLEPLVDQWKGVAVLLNLVLQKSLVNRSKENTGTSIYGEGSAFDSVYICDQVEAILQTFMVDPNGCDTVDLTVVDVPLIERQRWVQQLKWNEEPECGDGPLHFFYCAKSGDSSASGVVIPIEAVDIWLSEWENAYFEWSCDWRTLSPWLISGTRVLFHLTHPVSPKSLEHCEEWARQVDRLDPKQEETHGRWNQLHLALEPYGLLAPEDGGLLGHRLVQQGYSTLAQYREAAIALHAHANVIPAIFLPDCAHPLAATVSLHWFRLGPFHNATQDVWQYLNYGVQSFITSKSPKTSGSFASSCSGGGGGAFWYARGIAHSQLYAGRQAVQSNEFDRDRLSAVSARLSRAGHTKVARAIAAFAILKVPEQFQHWVELGMTFWYDGRCLEGMACLERAAEMNRGFALSPFLKQKRAEAMTQVTQIIPPPKSAEQYLEEALPEALPLWSSLPRVFHFSLVWLRSLVAESRFEAHWLALMDTVGDEYLGREIFRGLAPETQDRYLARQPLAQRKRLQAHKQPMGYI
ncbi:MAG: hypothetical protein AAGD25_36835 [Cyanobacteria bacterium P01_F01_bin.150]